jgi:hypothetical protein
MAVTVTTIADAFHFHVAEVEATADADAAAAIPHTLGDVPDWVSLVPLAAAFYLSEWRVTVIDAVNIELTKGTAVGSGAVGAQVRVQAGLQQMAPLAPDA